MKNWYPILLATVAYSGLSQAFAQDPQAPPVSTEQEPALIAAVRVNDLEQVKTLIGEGRGLLDVSAETNWSALHWSVRLEFSDITEELLSIPNLSQRTDSRGRTALHSAAAVGNVEAARLMVNRGIEIDTRDNLGATPLHLAVQSNHDEVARFLIEKRADVNARTKAGLSPLLFARFNGNRSMVELLSSAGAKPENLQLKPIPELPAIDFKAFAPKPIDDSNRISPPVVSRPPDKLESDTNVIKAGDCGMPTVPEPRAPVPIELPRDGSLPILMLDSTGGFVLPRKSSEPELIIYADGRAIITDPAGKLPRVTRQLSQANLKEFLGFVVNEHHFYELTTEGLAAELQAQAGGQEVTDLPTTILRLGLGNKSTEVRFRGAEFWAKKHPEVQPFQDFLAIEARLRKFINQSREWAKRSGKTP
jgi:hypothetical protein